MLDGPCEGSKNFDFEQPTSLAFTVCSYQVLHFSHNTVWCRSSEDLRFHRESVDLLPALRHGQQNSKGDTGNSPIKDLTSVQNAMKT